MKRQRKLRELLHVRDCRRRESALFPNHHGLVARGALIELTTRDRPFN